MSVKVFQIGFNKCGTSTLAWFFKRNGVPTVHWSKGEIARRIEAAHERGEDPLGFYKDVFFFSDMTYTARDVVLDGAYHFDYIHRFYPDALFILNTRPVDGWIDSRMRWNNYRERYKSARGIKTDEELAAYWRADWERHHRRVAEFFADKPGQLLVFDIEKDGPERIAEFVKGHYKLDTRHYLARKLSSMQDEKLAAKKARFLTNLGRDPAGEMTGKDVLLRKAFKRSRRGQRQERNKRRGKFVVRQTLRWRVGHAFRKAVAAVKRAFL